MVDKELLSRKISRLRTYTEALMSAEDIDWEKYKSDLRAKAFVERYLHLAIEEVIDITNHLISFFKWREPAGYRDLFQILKEHGIMSEKDLPTFQNMASFRNMLVHRYETIDEELVFGLFKKRLDDFELFIRMVVNWVERQKE
jgi:uncharacterized protein YutE (UPF0331/DUF86 family)